MKTKKVNRYYCEFCKKAGCSAGHIAKHEKHCTGNPDRVCGMCEMVDEEQKPMPELLAVMPDYTGVNVCGVIDEAIPYRRAVAVAMVRLSKLTLCPACTLAALRQRGCAGFSDYDFKSERDKVLSDWNEIQCARDFGG